MQQVHQIILNDQDDKKLSPFVEMATGTVKSKIPGSYRLWRRHELEDLMQREYGREVVQAFRKMKPYSYKSNLGRYVLLHHFGGWYLDLTIRIDPMAGTIDYEQDKELLLFRDVHRYAQTGHAIATGILWAARPRHRVYETAIEYVLRNCKEEYYGVVPTSVSGPNLLGEAVASHRCNPNYVWGDFLELTPTHALKNMAWVMPNGQILAWYKPAEGGDITSLGQKGTNNYNDFWNKKQVYDQGMP